MIMNQYDSMRELRISEHTEYMQIRKCIKFISILQQYLIKILG